MDLVREILRDKSPAQLLMLAAIALLFVSQFLFYLDDPGSAHLSIGADFSSTLHVFEFAERGTGWELHPHAWVILVALAFAFLRDDVLDHPLFVRFGWWLAVALVIAATIPGAYLRAPGGSLGGIAVLLALGAAVLHMVEVRRTRRQPPASPAS